MQNILRITKAVYLYNLDSSPRITDILNGDVCDPEGFLARRNLDGAVLAPDRRCFYRSQGNLASGGLIICDFHGKNPDVPNMVLSGLAEAPVIDGKQLDYSDVRNLKRETPLLPERIKLKSEENSFQPDRTQTSEENTVWRPRWPPAELNSHSPSVFKTIVIGFTQYTAVQAPEEIQAESLEAHNAALREKRQKDQCHSDLVLLRDAVDRYRADHPDQSLFWLNREDYSSFSGFLVKLGYLSSPIISECSFRIDSRYGDSGPVYCPKH